MISSANKSKINFRYHNPNTDDETLKHIIKICVEASRVKFENILRETAAQKDLKEDEKESPVD